MAKPPHHSGTYHVQARRIREQANANPDTRCWRCGKTMAEIRATKPQAKWTAGHLIAGQANGPMLPECSPCNYGYGNGRRGHSTTTTRTSASW